METVKFTELDIRPEILKAVANMGFEAMSPIQAKAIPVELSGRDVIGQAQTGTDGYAATEDAGTALTDSMAEPSAFRAEE